MTERQTTEFKRSLSNRLLGSIKNPADLADYLEKRDLDLVRISIGEFNTSGGVRRERRIYAIARTAGKAKRNLVLADKRVTVEDSDRDLRGWNQVAYAREDVEDAVIAAGEYLTQHGLRVTVFWGKNLERSGGRTGEFEEFKVEIMAERETMNISRQITS